MSNSLLFFQGNNLKVSKKRKLKHFEFVVGCLNLTRIDFIKKVSCQSFEILRCAFNVLSDVEKMSYLDVRNGVEKFRICTFWGGG